MYHNYLTLSPGVTLGLMWESRVGFRTLLAYACSRRTVWIGLSTTILLFSTPLACYILGVPIVVAVFRKWLDCKPVSYKWRINGPSNFMSTVDKTKQASKQVSVF